MGWDSMQMVLFVTGNYASRCFFFLLRGVIIDVQMIQVRRLTYLP